jgi:hypothetical protein
VEGGNNRAYELNGMADDYLRLRLGQLASKQEEAGKLREQLTRTEAQINGLHIGADAIAPLSVAFPHAGEWPPRSATPRLL